MTDNEIIKALEECIELRFDDTEYATVRLDTLSNALDLITRQQAEIERLKNENMAKEAEYNDMLEQRNSVERYLETAKSEAVKEFAARLKNEIISDTAYGCDSNQHSGYYDYTIKIGDIPEYIDNLVKEMVGDNNA